MSNANNPIPRPRKKNPWVWGALLVAITAALYLSFGRSTVRTVGTTFAVKRGALPINVLEGGSVEALESQEIRSQIKGYQGTKILSIVDEGHLVSEEEIKSGKILVELDSSDIKQKITTEEISYQGTLAALVQAQQAYDIQKNQNESDLKAAEQKARFALMDFEKFLGKSNTTQIIEQIGLKLENFTNSLDDIEREMEATPLALMQPAPEPPMANGQPGMRNQRQADGGERSRSNRRQPGMDTPSSRPAFNAPASERGSQPPVQLQPMPTTQPSAPPAKNPTESRTDPKTGKSFAPPVDFTKYAKEELLGDGAARQNLRKLQDDLTVSTQSYELAKTKYAGTKRLFGENFATKTELDNDELSVKQNEIKLASAQTALNLYIQYEFTRTAEDFLSKYDESLRLLVRARKEAISKMAQSRAQLKSSERRCRIEEEQLTELYDQMSNCVIRAQRPGLVVYGGGEDRRFGNEEPIREGATVRERQAIITIPDTTKMSVRLKIHESYIKKVKKGLKAKIQVDAFPDQRLEGEVVKVGVLPDSGNRWMNPDLKVYITSVAINGVNDWIKPGMSAKVEILVKTLDDVLYVPLQAVVPINGKHYAFVETGLRAEQREIEIGEFNDEFIEIKKGLKEGEKVLLRAPEGTDTGSNDIDESSDIDAPPAKANDSPAPAAGGPPGGAAKPNKGNRAP